MSAPSIDDTVPGVHADRRYADPPQDIAAEQAVLGACLLKSEAIEYLVDSLQVHHLYRPAHQAIYQVVCELFDNGQPTDAITVSAELQRRQELQRVGGDPYLHTLMASAPALSAGVLDSWSERIREMAAARKLGEIGTAFQVSSGLGGDRDSLMASLDAARDQLDDAAEWMQQGQVRETGLGAHVSRVLASIEERSVQGVQKGILTGFSDLDAVTHGLHPGQLVVVGARPGIGKSTLAVDFARAASIGQGLPSLVLSMEMDEDEVTERVLAAEAAVPVADLRSGRLRGEDWERLSAAVERVRSAPLHVLDISGASITELRAQARKMLRKHGIKLLVVDYLQLIESQGRVENRQIEVSGFSRKLKLLGKELGVPVVLVAQLNRGPEARQDHKPQMSDLRESGGIENDADMVLLIHRPDAYERDDPRMGEADLILAKHRGGPTTTVTVVHQLHYSRFVDMGTTGLTWEERFAEAAAPHPQEAEVAGGVPQ